jgi:hypothetical protein
MPADGAAEDPRHVLPSPGVFTRPLVVVEPEAGGRVYLNDTDQYAELGVSPHEGNRYVHATMFADGKAISPADLPRLAAEKNRAESRDVIVLDAQGNATFAFTNSVWGTGAAGLRKRYREMTPELRSRHHQELVGGIASDAVAEGPLVTEVEGYPSSYSYGAKAPRYAVRSGDTLTLLVSGPGSVMGLRSEKRENPLRTPGGAPSESVLTIVLPPEAESVLLLPPSYDWTYVFGSFSRRTRTFRDDAGRLCVEIVTKRDPESAILPAVTYPLLLEMNRRLAHPSMQTLVVKMAEGARKGNRKLTNAGGETTLD